MSRENRVQFCVIKFLFERKLQNLLDTIDIFYCRICYGRIFAKKKWNRNYYHNLAIFFLQRGLRQPDIIKSVLAAFSVYSSGYGVAYQVSNNLTMRCTTSRSVKPCNDHDTIDTPRARAHHKGIVYLAYKSSEIQHLHITWAFLTFMRVLRRF